MPNEISTPTPNALEDHAALREEVRGATTKRSLGEVARLSGVGYSTLAAWMGGKYLGDNVRVAEQLRTWLRSRETAAAVSGYATALTMPDFVATPTASSVLSVLQHAQYVPDLVVIAGGAGIGKTTSVREYARTNPNVWVITGEPSLASTHGTLELLCDALGIAEHSATRRSRAIAKRVSGSGGLIVVDEAQHLASAALDQLRTLHDKAGVGLALVGNEEVYARLDGGGRRAQFAQLFSRVGMRLTRARPTKGDIDALLEAAGVEGDADRKLLRAIAVKPGALRGMTKVLRVAHMLAAAEGVQVERAHLMRAWERLSAHAEVGPDA